MVKTQNKRQWVGIVALGLVLALSALPGKAAASDNPLWGSEYQIIEQTNELRQQNGLPALVEDSRLMASAANKAKDMAERGYFDHMNPDGFRMDYWIHGQGYFYTIAGENIAKGFDLLDRLMAAWENSPTHYKNLVEPRFTRIGVGMAEGWYEDQETLFIVQHFGDEGVVTPPQEAAISQPTTGGSVKTDSNANITPASGGQGLLNFVSITPAVAADIRSLEAAVASLPVAPVPASNPYTGLIWIILLGVIGYLRESDWQKLLEWMTIIRLKISRGAELFLHYSGF